MTPVYYAKLLYEALRGSDVKHQNKIFDNLKNILIRNKETYLSRALIKEFGKIRREKERENVTYISSYAKLSSKQRGELESLFPEPRAFSENQSLLGGIAIRQKDRIYNATLRKKIESLRSSL